MNFETQRFNDLKHYLESLGYPSSSIFQEYNGLNSKIDAVVRAKDRTLIAIEIKRTAAVRSITTDEIGYHPITRSLQKLAVELNAKYYLLSDGEQHLWLKTGQNGRPEKTTAVSYANFNTHTLSEFEFTKELLVHIAEYIRNYPLTGDHLYDMSIVLYAKLTQEIPSVDAFSIDLQDIVGTHYIHEKSPSDYSPNEILKEALIRLTNTDLMDNRIAVFEFIDTFFEASRKEWNVPRWMADFMVSLVSKNKQAKLLDIFSRNGILTSAAYLRGFQNVNSYYVSHKELYWIKIQQILGNQNESEVKFEPSLLKGGFEVLPVNSMDAVLLAPPFNLKFENHINSYLGRQGVKDGNILFLEASLNVANKDGQVVAIVPDGFLLSAQYQKARAYFESKIEAIISLPDGAFKPYSAVKVSLVLFAKSRLENQAKVFMAFLDKVPECNPLYKEYDDVEKNILNNLELFRAKKEISSSEHGFIVDKLNAENFHISKYWLNKRSKLPNITKSGFSVLPLKEIVKTISRGSPIVNDIDNGNIAYIGPAAVRELQLNKEHLAYTSEKKLPNGKVQRVATNDILINIIGPYRGKAALVSKEFDGMFVNRHIAVIKPNTDLILPGYLAVALNSEFVQEQFHDHTSGTVIPALNLSSFEQISLPVPDIETQIQIYSEYAQRLDELIVINAKAVMLQSEISQRLSNLGKEGDKL